MNLKCLLTSLAVPFLLLSSSEAGTAPQVLGVADGTLVIDGPCDFVDMIMARKSPNGKELVRKRSRDGGVSWSKPATIFRQLPQKFGRPLALRTSDGELQLFWLVRRGRGKPGVDYLIDIWHSHSSDRQSVWSEPKLIYKGYVGSINGMTQLENGRIILPFAYWLGGVRRAPPVGPNITTTLYSDDGGHTWKGPEAKLTAPCYENYNGDNVGAVEPSVVQLQDGRVWMLIRTQTGWMYESFSKDGAEWSPTTRSRFCSSNSPAWLVRTSNGRLVVFWNNCENTSRIDKAGVYTNRDALHAAVSNNEGQSWHGYREVCRDPFRNQPPPKRGDRGTAYPYATPTADGKILLVTGQGHGRRNLVRFDPAWLDETYHEDDFSGGLDGWSVFTSFGKPIYWWRNRTVGPRLIDHPDKVGAKVLQVRRADDKPGDGAVWNFPAGVIGKLTIRIKLLPKFAGCNIALADRFIQPTDNIGEKKVLFALPITSDGELPSGHKLQKGRWYSIALDWDLSAAKCSVSIDGKPAAKLDQSHKGTAGACYLRLRSTAKSTDMDGFLLDKVAVDVKNDSRK